jgi:3-oxoacyl-[acyl-carrier-protein] synthase-3
MINSAGIIGTGAYLPNKKLNNSDLGKICKMSPKEILKKTGIKFRRIAEKNETASSMGLKASLQAIKKSKIDKKDIEMVICCSFSGEYIYPALACKISQLLELDDPGCFDVMANCTGFQTGLDIAFDKIKTSNSIKNILVVAVAMQSRYIDWRDKNSAIYFGDGASAAIVSKVKKKYGHLGCSLISNTKVYDAVRMRGGGSSYVTSNYLKQKNNQKYEISGLEVWKQVVTNQPKNIRLALRDAKLKTSDVDFFIFHQANDNLIKYLMHRLEIPIKKTYITANKYGNTADASMGITLHEAVTNNKIKKNDVVLISGVGAGFIFGTTILKWCY